MLINKKQQFRQLIHKIRPKKKRKHGTPTIQDLITHGLGFMWLATIVGFAVYSLVIWLQVM